jgi:hypothetical protein
MRSRRALAAKRKLFVESRASFEVHYERKGTDAFSVAGGESNDFNVQLSMTFGAAISPTLQAQHMYQQFSVIEAGKCTRFSSLVCYI